MAITLTGAGGLFTRLGKLAGALNDLNTFRGGTSSGQLVLAVTDALAEVDGDTAAIRYALQGLNAALPAGQGALTPLANALRTAAQNLLIAQVNADTPLVQQTVPYALAVLKAQMLSGGDYVSPNTVSATPAAGGSNTGNGAIVCGTRDPYGYQLDNLLAETLQVSVTAEESAGGSLLFQGTKSQADPLNWQWPAGSGANALLTAIAPAANTGYVAGGDFETFTVANLPDGWTATLGTAGTDFGAAGSGYAGANALKFIGGTGVLTNLTQTLTALTARTPYAINFWVKESGSPASGVLQVDLYNGASIIQDEAGNNCSLAINLTSLTTSYVAHGAIWSIADPLPATVTLRLHLTTACPAAANVFVDQLTLQPATQLGLNPGDSIYAAAAAGSVDFCLRDTFTIAVANNRTSKWQQAFDRLFNCRALGFVLPTSGSTLINDSLISD
ncbi:MAG TPA: hypothetical protein VG826_29245 [Pirellulales bacterium]|nr:hypothetical protein [Pirellulales bacterium]